MNEYSKNITYKGLKRLLNEHTGRIGNLEFTFGCMFLYSIGSIVLLGLFLFATLAMYILMLYTNKFLSFIPMIIAFILLLVFVVHSTVSFTFLIIKRLHDLNKSGWHSLLIFFSIFSIFIFRISYVNTFYMLFITTISTVFLIIMSLILMFKAGSAESNKYNQ